MNWNKAHEQARAKVMPVQANPTRVTFFDRKGFKALCTQIETAYPELEPSTDAVANAGIGRDGEPIKLAVYVRGANKAEGLKAGNVTLYGSGKAVWTNLAPI